MLLAKKNFEFHAQVQKCHFGNFVIFAKIALLNPIISADTVTDTETTFQRENLVTNIVEYFFLDKRAHIFQ